MNNVNIEITENAQLQIKDAIKYKAHHDGEALARDTIKSIVGSWIDQLEILPESGKSCPYYDAPEVRELIKDGYRFIYEIRQTDGDFDIYLMIFCHERMDYETLIHQYTRY